MPSHLTDRKATENKLVCRVQVGASGRKPYRNYTETNHVSRLVYRIFRLQGQRGVKGESNGIRLYGKYGFAGWVGSERSGLPGVRSRLGRFLQSAQKTPELNRNNAGNMRLHVYEKGRRPSWECRPFSSLFHPRSQHATIGIISFLAGPAWLGCPIGSYPATGRTILLAMPGRGIGAALTLAGGRLIVRIRLW
jgi:hypothetical protein